MHPVKVSFVLPINMLPRVLFPFVVIFLYMIYTNGEECSSNLDKDLIHVVIQRMEAMETKMKLMERHEIAVRQRETAMMRRIEYLQMKLTHIETYNKEAEKRQQAQQTEIQQLQRDCYNQLEQTNTKMDILLSKASVKKHKFSEIEDLYDENTFKSFVKEPNVTNMTERERNLNYRSKRADSVPVAFSTYLSHYAYHLGIDQIIRYDGVLTNEGNAYNPITGVFTCPQDGLYLLAFVTATVNEHKAWVKLVVDGAYVSHAVSEGVRGGHDDQGGNVAILRLSAGQSVWTATTRAESELDSLADTRHVTFSGVRLSD